MEDHRTDSHLYAAIYSRTPLLGIRYLMFRDTPALIKKFVSGTRALDYGCGPGHSSCFLKSVGMCVDSVDISKEMIHFAKKNDPTGNYSVINSGELNSKNCYDLVFASCVFPFVSSKEEMLKIMNAIWRALKNDGTFLILGPNENTYKYKWLEDDTDFEQNKNPTSGSFVKTRTKSNNVTLCHYYWSNDDYCEVLNKSRFKILNKHCPLGKLSDGFAWETEMDVQSCTIYVAKKISSS